MKNIDEQNMQLKSNAANTKPISFSKHVIYVFILSVILAIPLTILLVFINDRADTFNNAYYAVIDNWDGNKKISVYTGYSLLDPKYITTNSYLKEKDFEKKLKEAISYDFVDNLDTKILISSEKRNKGVFDFLVYKAQVSVKGTIDNKEMIDNCKKYNCFLAIGNMSVKLDKLVINNKNYTKDKIILDPLLSSRNILVLIDKKDVGDTIDFNFSYKTHLNNDFGIYLLANNNSDLTISGNGSLPMLEGKGPDSYRNIENGYVLNYSWQSSFTQATNKMNIGHFDNIDAPFSRYDINTNAAYITFKSPNVDYTALNRIVKYSMLFIFLSFVAILAFEYYKARRLLPLHYMVISFALLLFYMIVLAVMEYTGFSIAYILAMILMSLMISLYIKSLFNSYKAAFTIGACLIGLYLLLLALTLTQRYTLLLGTIILVLILGLIMYITKNIKSDNQL